MRRGEVLEVLDPEEVYEEKREVDWAALSPLPGSSVWAQDLEDRARARLEGIPEGREQLRRYERQDSWRRK